MTYSISTDIISAKYNTNPQNRNSLMFNSNKAKALIVVDNFYKNPDTIRTFAYQQEFKHNNALYKGMRTPETFLFKGLKEEFEFLLQEKITLWEEHQFNGCFQVTSAENQQVYHCDENSWAAVIYLTPEAPPDSGTCLYRSKSTGMKDSAEGSKEELNSTFSGGFYDATKFDLVDKVGNLYNRLVIFKSTRIHSAGSYFGTNLGNGRLVHLFFFNTTTTSR